MLRRSALPAALALGLAAPRASGQASMVPEWLARDAAVLSGQREGTLPGVESLYAAASAAATHVDELAGALLVCHVATSESGPRGRWDSFADPDLRIELRAGRSHGTAWGPENAMTAYVSFAGVTLRTGDAIEVRVWDRDVTGDERIDTLRGRFDGSLPLALSHEATSITCGQLDAARAAREAASALVRAEAALGAVEAATPSLTDAGLGRPAREDTQASGDVALAMAWAGVRDPRARAVRDRLTAARASFDRALGAAVREARASRGAGPVPIPGTSTTVRLEGTLTAVRAIRAQYPDAPQPISAVIELVLDPPASEPAAVLGTPDVVDSRGIAWSTLAPVRSPGDPARVGLPVTGRPAGGVLRVGTGIRALLVAR